MFFFFLQKNIMLWVLSRSAQEHYVFMKKKNQYISALTGVMVVLIDRRANHAGLLI